MNQDAWSPSGQLGLTSGEWRKRGQREEDSAGQGADRRVWRPYHRPVGERPPLSYAQILEWADSHRMRNGIWPTESSGRVKENPCENWSAISAALDKGYRGLPGGLSLVQLLMVARGKRNVLQQPRLKVRQILEWADAHFNRHGIWPRRMSGAIPNSNGETWARVDVALSRGRRGFPGGSSLRQFLTKRRTTNIGVLRSRRPDLTIRRILAWADDHFVRTGRWPVSRSGRISNSDEHWNDINLALIHGRRGLPGGSSLARLMEEFRKGDR